MSSHITSQSSLGVFAGSSSLLDFLDPGKHPPTPLVELPPELNPFHSYRVRIFMKLLFMTPIFNAKLLASRSLFEKAKKRGDLEGVHTLVENSSGNKILADALLAWLFGIRRVVAIVPLDIPADKQRLLELFGVECMKSRGGIEKAQELGQQPGWWNPAQYHNEDNPEGSYRWLGPQIWEQTRGEITIFCTGIGTGGTIIGTTNYLREMSPSVIRVGVIPSTDEVPGVRTIQRLDEVGLSWQEALDSLETVDVIPSYFQSLRLCSKGILGGPSSGMALAGLFQYLDKAVSSDSVDMARNANGEVIAVSACPDSALLYLDKYTTRLTSDQLEEAIVV